MRQLTKEEIQLCELAKKHNAFQEYIDEKDGDYVLIDKIPKDQTELIEDAKLFNRLLIKLREEAERMKATGMDW